MSAPSDRSVISLMHVIAGTPAVNADTRVRAAVLAHKLEQPGLGVDFGSIFDDVKRRGRQTP